MRAGRPGHNAPGEGVWPGAGARVIPARVRPATLPPAVPCYCKKRADADINERGGSPARRPFTLGLLFQGEHQVGSAHAGEHPASENERLSGIDYPAVARRDSVYELSAISYQLSATEGYAANAAADGRWPTRVKAAGGMGKRSLPVWVGLVLWGDGRGDWCASNAARQPGCPNTTCLGR